MVQNEIGTTGVVVTELGLGCGPFGNMMRAMNDTDATETVASAIDAGISYFDTAPSYGFGLSEKRLGQALTAVGSEKTVISSKVGYDLRTIAPSVQTSKLWVDTPGMAAEYDFGRDAVLRSIDASLSRLGVDSLDMVAIHDPDGAVKVGAGEDPYSKSHFKEAMDGAFPELASLRNQGVIKAIGVGLNQWQMLCDFAIAGDFDYFLLAGRYTLLDQSSLARLMPICEERHISLVIGGPYNSGILATGAVDGATYNYSPASAAVMDKVSKIQAVCDRYGIPLPAAALRFPLLHPLVASTIPGARSPAEVVGATEMLSIQIPDDFWEELKAEGLILDSTPIR